MYERTGRVWLLLIYRVPQEPAGRRTYVWRHLKQLGAVYLQQAAAILPASGDTRGALEALAGRIREFGGEASLLRTTSPTRAWEDDLIARFNRARDDEYAEVVENAGRLEEEVRRESAATKFTFAELEDIEADAEKLQKWFDRVAGRDAFGAQGRSAAEDALGRARTAVEAFARSVYRHEDVQEDGT
jgi:hypothetical protein